jgi:putative hydrolase of the HAD superfamily
MRTVDTVLFDLDDTLHDDSAAYQGAAEQVAAEIAAEHAIDALALKTAYVGLADKFWQKLDPSSLSVRLKPLRISMWGEALSSVGLDEPALADRAADRYVIARNERLELFPGAVDLLKDLKARGCKLGLLTNGFSETHRDKIELLQIGAYFDAVFIADEVGMLKPDPLLFAHACLKLESAPSHSAMVGDRYNRDIIGGIKAGLFTVWLNLHDSTLAPGEPPPDATVRSIEQVASVLPIARLPLS